MVYKNPIQIIRQCNEELKRNEKVLKEMAISEDMKQAIINDIARLEKIKTEAEKQIEA